MVSFPYRRERSALLGEVLRPVASVQVRGRRGPWYPALMYVDSGADLTLVPEDFGRLLGMDLTENSELITGVAGSPVRVSIQQAEVWIGGRIAKAKIAVAMRNDVPYLLGREGLFRLFKIVFEEYKAQVRFDTARQS